MQGHRSTTSGDHMRDTNCTHAQRLAARNSLKEIPGAGALFELERPKRSDVGEGSEPEGTP